MQSRPRTALLLGPGGTGKTAFAAQLAAMCGVPPRSPTRETVEHLLHEVLRGIIEEGLRASTPLPKLPPSVTAAFCLGCSSGTGSHGTGGAEGAPGSVTPATAEAVARFWADERVQRLWSRGGGRAVSARGEHANYDVLEELLGRVREIFAGDYEFSEADALAYTCRTTGLASQELPLFAVHQPTRILSVGGRTNERKKWRHAYGAGVDTVFFFVSADDVGLGLTEKPSEDRLGDALELFSSCVNDALLADTPVVLVLTRVDLLPATLEGMGGSGALRWHTPFQDFDGDERDADAVCAHLERRFVALDGSPGREVRCVRVNNRDAETVRAAVEQCEDLLRRAPREAPLPVATEMDRSPRLARSGSRGRRRRSLGSVVGRAVAGAARRASLR